MELEELKNTWSAFEEQLKKNEKWQKQIVQEVLCKKSNKSLNWLINFDLFGIIVYLLAIPFWVWFYSNHFYHKTFLSVKILSIFCIVYSIICIAWSFYKLKYIMKVNFSQNVKDNIYRVNKYTILLKKEKLATYFIATPILSSLGVFCYYELKASISLWSFLIVALTIATTITYWLYKRFYDTNIQSIKKRLDELKELEEETEEK